jgi:hypothetical protein
VTYRDPYIYPVPISGRASSPAVIAPGGASPAQLTLAPTVDVALDDLRIAFSPEAPAVAGANVRFLITSIRVGDDLMWNDVGGGGTDASNFEGNSTLRNMLGGRRASPAQPIVLTGNFVNLGSAASANPASVSASAIGRKRSR